MLYRVKLSVLLQIAAFFCFAPSVFAVGLPITVREGFDVSGTAPRSYDGPTFDAFKPYSAFSDGKVYALDTLVGGAQGTNVEFFLLSEYAGFDGRFEAANKLGVIDSNNIFQSLIDTRTLDPLAVASLTLDPGEKFTVALNSPQALLSTIDSSNPNSAAHVLALQIAKPGEVKVPQTKVTPSSELSFNLLSGDLVLFFEDLVLSNNNTFGGLVPLAGDYDYNDMVVVLRCRIGDQHIPVPEPTSLALLGVGALAGLYRRRFRRV